MGLQTLRGVEIGVWNDALITEKHPRFSPDRSISRSLLLPAKLVLDARCNLIH